MLGLEACAGLAASHSLLVGGAKKLLEAGLCDLITAGLRFLLKASISLISPFYESFQMLEQLVELKEVRSGLI